MQNYFDTDVAETYDQVHAGSDTGTVAQMADLLRDLAGDGPALEFAIGTGRVALPLQDRGVTVSGIELSAPMVDQLRAKPRGAGMDIRIGDMTVERFDTAFSLVYLVYNTIDNLTTQAAQVACFRNAAHHLQPGGRFVIETLLPPIQKLPFGQTLLAFACNDEHMGVDKFDVATQTYSSNHVQSDGDDISRLSVPFRYAWPAEMDLMAQLAGIEFEDRWADWAKTPFDRYSTSHVSVWRKPG